MTTSWWPNVYSAYSKIISWDRECSERRRVAQLAATSKPDVVLMDIGMPVLNGIKATRRLRKVSPATKIIILTEDNQTGYVDRFRAFAKIADECEEWLVLHLDPRQTRLMQIKRRINNGAFGHQEKRRTFVGFAHREEGGGKTEIPIQLAQHAPGEVVMLRF